MVIYLYGTDSYKRQEKLNWYLQKFREKHSALTVERFDLAETNGLHKLKDFATAQSLFDNFKFGVLENVGEANSKELQSIFQLSGESKTLTLVISVDKPLAKDFKVPAGGENKSHEFAGPDSWARVTEQEKIALGGLPELVSNKHDFFALANVLQSEGPPSYKLPALERLLLENDPAAVFNFIASRAGAELKTKMADLDAAIKSGKTEYEEALLDLVLS